MTRNSTIVLTENNKCKYTGSQTRDDNLQEQQQKTTKN